VDIKGRTTAASCVSIAGLGGGGNISLILGTTDEVIVMEPSPGVVVVSTPQPTAPTSMPTFRGVTLTDFVCAAGSTAYSTGTASQSGVTVTGASGADFSAVQPGSAIYWAGATAWIANVVDSTHVTVTPSQTVGSGSYTICNGGVQAAKGNLGVADSLWLGNAVVSGLPTFYATGTASLSGSTITGTGTAFTAAIVGAPIFWPAAGAWDFITGYTSATSLSALGISSPVADGPFIIPYAGLGSFSGQLGLQALFFQVWTAVPL
jgi:hypothetical protein